MRSEFSEWVENTITEKKLKRIEVAEKAGISRSRLTQIINETPHSLTGVPTRASIETVDAIAKAMGEPISVGRMKAGYFPPDQDLNVQAERLLYYFNRLDTNWQAGVIDIVEVVWRRQQEELMAVPVIADSAVAKEKPDKGEDSDGRTDDRDSHTWNSKRRKAG